MSQYFPKTYEPLGGDINVKVDLTYYATKTDLKNVTHVDVSSFALKSNLADLKTEVDKLNIDKLTPVSNDLAKLSNGVKNDVVKNNVYDKLVAKVNNIDSTGFVLKTTYDTDKSDLEKKISDADKNILGASDLAKKTDLNAKIIEVKGKIPNITGLATNSALIAFEYKIPDVGSLVKKTDYDTKISDIEKKITDHNQEKYITTPESNNLAAGVFTARLAQANLVPKTDFDAKLQDISKIITSNKSKHLLFETELKKLEKFYAPYFKGKNYFDGDGTQNYLVFQPVYKYFKKIGSTKNIAEWKSTGLSNKKISSTTA